MCLSTVFERELFLGGQYRGELLPGKLRIPIGCSGLFEFGLSGAT